LSDYDTALRISLPAYFVAYFLIAFAWRSYRVWKTTGINPYVLTGGDDAYGYIGRWFKLLMLASAAVVVCIGWFGALPEVFGPWDFAAQGLARILGWNLLAMSLVWIAVAQWQMGQSWRIGIDTKNKTALVSSGLFAVSRNPIFLGMRVNLLGFFLVLPSALTALIFILGEVLMQIQVRLEEAFLTGKHGEAYADYCTRVRRWL
jgi:protein-S-isoprenylcysteine O-methyltransferase Ste14